MSEYKILRRVSLESYHAPTGRTHHYAAAGEIPAPAQLWIVQIPPRNVGFYLLYLDYDGNEQTDTFHNSLDQALDQSTWEFNVMPDEWERLRGR